MKNKKKITKDVVLMRILCVLTVFGIAGLIALSPIPATMIKTVAKETKETKNVNNEFTIDQVTTSPNDFVKITESLYYDPATGITYMKQYTYGFMYVYTQYPAPNGLPFRYDPNRKIFYMTTHE